MCFELLIEKESADQHSADLSDAFRDLLVIEFHHLKLYTGALSIQAVVERALARGISATDKSQADVFKACVLAQD